MKYLFDLYCISRKDDDWRISHVPSAKSRSLDATEIEKVVEIWPHLQQSSHTEFYRLKVEAITNLPGSDT